MANAAGFGTQQKIVERRSSRRKRAFLQGKIVYGRGHSFECTIRDISETGARAEIPAGQVVPERIFLIATRDGIAHDCEVKWQAPMALGLMFRRSFPLSGPLPDDASHLKQLWSDENNRPADITTEMISAGVAAMEAWKAENVASSGSEREMVRSIYAAMNLAGLKQRASSGQRRS